MAGNKHDRSDTEDNTPVQGTSTSQSGTKRARTTSSLPPSSPPPEPTSTQEGEENAENADEEEEEEEEEDDDVDMEDNEEDTRITQEATRMAKSKANNELGTEATSGVIEEVNLTNFMCHALCTVKFGPRINFIVGNNGSGKSAVLTGISMALGGSAKGSNRGKKGADLVKHGSPHAIASVRIKNVGVDAFKFSTYGKHITIERRMNSDGGGGYKIKDSDGKVRDTKKSTLDAIADHFNIQVENPMTILTQDQARQFLNTSSPTDKYNFFLRGTQLAQLTHEYEILRENTGTMEANLDRKQAVLPELKLAYRRAKERAEEAQAAIGQAEKVEILKNELAWSYVVEKENLYNESLGVLDTSKRNRQKVEAKISESQQKLQDADDYRGTLEEGQFENQQTLDKLGEELAKSSAELVGGSAKMRELMDFERTINHDVKGIENSITAFEAELAAERAKLSRDVDAEKQQLRDRQAELTDSKEKLTYASRKADKEIEDVLEEVNVKREALVGAKATRGHLESELTSAKGRLALLNKAQQDPMQNYGGDCVSKLLHLIKQERGWQYPPMGPVGIYCKLKDPKYSALLEALFAQTLNAFVVKTQADKQRLQKLARQANCTSNQPIICQPEDPHFDCSSGEPPSNILTVLRVLEISDPYIRATLVNNKNIESAALVAKRSEGDDLMANRPPKVMSCFSADMFKLGGVDGGAGSQSVRPWTSNKRLTQDFTAERQRRQSDIAEADQQFQAAKQAVQEIEEYLQQLGKKLAELNRSKLQHGRQQHKVNDELDNVEAQLNIQEDAPNLAAIEDQLREKRAELETTLDQYKLLVDEKDELRESQIPLIKAKEAVVEQIRAAEKLKAKILTKLEANTTERLQQQKDIKTYEGRLTIANTTIEGYESQLEAQQATLDLEIEKATVVCAVRPTPSKRKTPQKYIDEIETIKKALKEREIRQGATIEQIMEEVVVRQKTAQDAVNTCNDLLVLIKALVAAYDSRIARWTDFREAIAHRAKLQFHYHLSRRNYTGKLSFNHDKCLLNLRVQIDPNSKLTQKDPKGLSGGEKSFSTICLLLTMWEAVGCPVRCLDEFDVFMDALNRRVSMKMMIDTAKAADNTQFILISPQSNNGGWDPEVVRVTKMRDPERGQGTLAMGN